MAESTRHQHEFTATLDGISTVEIPIVALISWRQYDVRFMNAIGACALDGLAYSLIV